MSTMLKPFLDIKVIQETQSAIRTEPELGKVTFKVTGKSSGGVAIKTHTGALIQNKVADKERDGMFSMVSDEPIALLGTNTGVSPAEYILQGLAGCYTVTLASMASNKGIALDSISLDLEFDIDLNGFLGLDPNVRNGAQEIRVQIGLESETTCDEELEALVSAIHQHSPIHDTLENPVVIKPTFKKVEK